MTGDLAKIRENGATSGIGVLATYAYDNLGRQTSVAFGNGTSQASTYDPVSRLASLTANLTGTANDLTIGSLAYNPASQIVSQNRSNDAFAWTGHVDGTKAGTANGLNQLTQYGSKSLSHDAKGNVTGFGSDTFAYSSENLLTSATVGGTSTTLGYDPAMRLQQTVSGGVTTKLAYDGLDRLAEYNGSGTIQRRYAPGDALGAPVVWYEGSGTTDRRFLSTDERGSVVAVSDASGNLLAANSYDEFGNPGASNMGAFGYTGQAWLPTVKVWYYKARELHPELGRFLQTDPLGYLPGTNPYAYVLNDPVNLTDPLGLSDGDIIITGARFNFSAPEPTGGAALLGGGGYDGATIGSGEGGNSGEIVIIGTRPHDECKEAKDCIVVTAAPTHRVEYHITKGRFFHIWFKHASIFGELAGASQFNDPADIPSLIYKAVTRSTGRDQPNGRTVYVYENDRPVGTYPNGDSTNYVTVVTSHAPGNLVGYIVTAFPGLPGYGQ